MIYLKILAQEVKTGFLNSFSYKFGIFFDLLLYIGLYCYLVFSGSGYSLVQDYSASTDAKTLVISGYLLWILTNSVFSTAISDIQMDNIKGILQKKFMAVVPFQWILFCSAISNVAVQLVVIIIIFLASLIITGGVPITLAGVIIGAISLIGMYGISLIVGAIVLEKKKIGQLSLVINIFLLFAGNVITTAVYGPIMKLIPLSYANHLIRLDFVGTPVDMTEYILFLGVNIFWCVVGVVTMNKAIKKAKDNGTLELY